MCGIVGSIRIGNCSASTLKDVVRMCDTIKHRGPDSEGYLLFDDNNNPITFFGDDTKYKENVNLNYFPKKHVKDELSKNGNVIFGHRRLSIIDLSAKGHQPMNYLNRYWIVYNGEIFNYLELRSKLEKLGYNFNSNTDTEVILASFAAWGPDSVNHFNGMWAFVIYDSKEDTIFISRDRFGIKPLYYTFTDSEFLFSSEIKGLLSHPKIEAKPNYEYLNLYLKYGPQEYMIKTSFSGVYRFLHSHYFFGHKEELKYIRNKVKEYWSIKPNSDMVNISEENLLEYSEAYYKLLYDSVKLRLRSDVKVGSALSGGIDSSSVVFLINQIYQSKGINDTQITFSSIYRDKPLKYCDESEYIDLCLKDNNIKSYKIQPNHDEVISEYPKMIYAMENPPGNSHMSGWFVFKMVGESEVTVTLDGQGADEQLCGYLRIKDFFSELPIRRYLSEYHALKSTVGVVIKSMLIGAAKKMLRPFLSSEKINVYKNHNERLAYETMHGLITLIHYSDSLSMAHSVESRLPFMDYRLVEFLSSIPSSYKFHNGWTKFVARKAFDKKINDKIVWRKDKVGWPQPEEYWFNGPLNNWMETKISNSDLLNSNKIDNKFNNQNSLEQKLRFLNLAIWEEIFISKSINFD